MCVVVHPPACRLCLREQQPSECFYFLLENELLTKKYTSILNLQTDLYDANILPNHICRQCQASLDQVINQMKIFTNNEKFILKHQALIKSAGLKEAKVQEYFKEDKITSDKPEADVSKKYKCHTCHKAFSHETQLRKHLLTHDQERRECPKCPGKSFASSTFINHIREVHNVGKHIACLEPSCEVRFRKRGDMMKHHETVHQNKKELCIECGEYFKNLKYHRETVHEGIRYKCESCDKEYRTEKMLRQHVETVHEKRRSICEICAVEVIDLRNHMKLNHEGPVEKTEPCPDENCRRKFRTSQEAKKHYKSYHLEIKEMCPECGGWFKALYQHTLAVHKNLKKHVCGDCGKGFTKKHDLSMHKNRVHLGIKYVCPQCGKHVSKLRDHIKMVHGILKPADIQKEINLAKTNKMTPQPPQLSNLDQTLLPCENPDDPSPVPNIHDIIKRCVSSIDHQMVLPVADNTGLTTLMDSVSEPVNSGPLADFGTVYGSSQLPSLHTVFRTKMEAESQDMMTDTQAHVETDNTNNINMYQWLQSSE